MLESFDCTKNIIVEECGYEAWKVMNTMERNVLELKSPICGIVGFIMDERANGREVDVDEMMDSFFKNQEQYSYLEDFEEIKTFHHQPQHAAA